MAEAVFKAGHGAGESWAAAVKACLQRLGAVPAGANLGFLYATDAMATDLSSALTFLRETTRIEHWVGSVGLGVAACGVEYYGRPAVAVLVAALPEDSFRVFDPITADDAGGGLDRLSRLCGAWLARHQPIFGVVHGDPRNAEMHEIIGAVAGRTSTFLVGGLTASRAGFPQIAERVTEGGLSGVFFAPEHQVAAGLSQGCTPIAAPHTVTEGENNLVRAIDGRPALEVLREDLGETLAQDPHRIAGGITVAFPVAGSDTGDYVVRNLMAIDPARGWLSIGELVEPGQSIMFCRRDRDSALQDLQRMAADVKRRAGPAPKAGIYFSCVARGQNLFGPNSEELALIRDLVGDIPLAGFFANGEISNNRLYGYTGVLALFL